MDPDAFTVIFIVVLIFVAALVTLFVWVFVDKTASFMKKQAFRRSHPPPDRPHIRHESVEAELPTQVTIV
jgi:flagellar basal body-associated protein FliL